MQTIKCVVVGDGAVGKVRSSFSLEEGSRKFKDELDLSVDILHYQQIPK